MTDRLKSERLARIEDDFKAYISRLTEEPYNRGEAYERIAIDLRRDAELKRDLAIQREMNIHTYE